MPQNAGSRVSRFFNEVNEYLYKRNRNEVVRQSVFAVGQALYVLAVWETQECSPATFAVPSWTSPFPLNSFGDPLNVGELKIALGVASTCSQALPCPAPLTLLNMDLSLHLDWGPGGREVQTLPS